MLFNLIIILILFLAFYSGVKRGLILQLTLTIGYAVSFWFALNYHEVFSYYVEMFIPYPTPLTISTNPFVLYGIEFLFELDGAFYRGMSFLLILFVGWLLTRLIGGLLSFLADIPGIRVFNAIGGAVVSLVVHYIGLFLVLFVLSTVPLTFLQEQFASSTLARGIVTSTPELSAQFYDWWVEDSIDN
ncbi:CvpA family protein [Alkalibacterium sp. MB6]|uniref:CvpA family protein n=1 Tax=Alkalibacterium sp. MB6 TaxID=2081965 RepID=UPI001379EF11|nr:CvpA family protein [Alkalibacterium sp. MB6]